MVDVFLDANEVNLVKTATDELQIMVDDSDATYALPVARCKSSMLYS
jgi:hypothetical protein